MDSVDCFVISEEGMKDNESNGLNDRLTKALGLDDSFPSSYKGIITMRKKLLNL